MFPKLLKRLLHLPDLNLEIEPGQEDILRRQLDKLIESRSTIDTNLQEMRNFMDRVDRYYQEQGKCQRG